MATEGEEECEHTAFQQLFRNTINRIYEMSIIDFRIDGWMRSLLNCYKLAGKLSKDKTTLKQRNIIVKYTILRYTCHILFLDLQKEIRKE